MLESAQLADGPAVLCRVLSRAADKRPEPKGGCLAGLAGGLLLCAAFGLTVGALIHGQVRYLLCMAAGPLLTAFPFHAQSRAKREVQPDEVAVVANDRLRERTVAGEFGPPLRGAAKLGWLTPEGLVIDKGGFSRWSQYESYSIDQSTQGMYRVRLWRKPAIEKSRRPAAVAIAVLVVLGVLAGFAVAGWGWHTLGARDDVLAATCVALAQPAVLAMFLLFAKNNLRRQELTGRTCMQVLAVNSRRVSRDKLEEILEAALEREPLV